MSDDPAFKAAAGVAELLDDCLNIVQGDARRLAEDAAVNAKNVAGSEWAADAAALSARADRLVAKIAGLLGEARPRLAEIVTEDRLRSGATVN